MLFWKAGKQNTETHEFFDFATDIEKKTCKKLSPWLEIEAFFGGWYNGLSRTNVEIMEDINQSEKSAFADLLS